MSKSNNTSNKIHRLWPTSVGEFFNPDHQKIRDKLIDFLKIIKLKIQNQRKVLKI